MSIFKKLSILFIISLILMIIIGSWIDKINSNRIEALVKEKYINIIDELIKNFDNNPNLKNTIENYNLEILENYHFLNSQEIYSQDYIFGNVKILKETFEDEFIIKINYLDEKLLLKTPDIEDINDKPILNILISLDILALILIFLYILRLLSPLKQITNKIIRFANGNFDSRINITTNDEIGLLSKTFDEMADKLEKEIRTKEELLRDIGHELKTPITKGKFAVEKIEDSSQKELFKKIFNDLDSLTSELIELEKLNSKELNKTIFQCETLVIEALDKLYLEDESKIKLEIIKNFKINGDLHYLTKAVKNLIENALKYSDSFPISIQIDDYAIIVKNRGKQLSKELEYYLKPFTQELSNRNGFGLGLCIVKKVVDKHHFQLEYFYEDGFNVFKILITKNL